MITDRTAAEPAKSARVLVNDAEVVLASLRAGLGKSLLPTSIGDRLRCIRRVEDEPVDLQREIWLLLHPELQKLGRVRVVTQWIVELFNEVRDRAA